MSNLASINTAPFQWGNSAQDIGCFGCIAERHLVGWSQFVELNRQNNQAQHIVCAVKADRIHRAWVPYGIYHHLGRLGPLGYSFPKPQYFDFLCFTAYSDIQGENPGLDSNFQIPFVSWKSSIIQDNASIVEFSNAIFRSIV